MGNPVLPPIIGYAILDGSFLAALTTMRNVGKHKNRLFSWLELGRPQPHLSIISLSLLYFPLHSSSFLLSLSLVGP
jgi:hypothetical protein